MNPKMNQEFSSKTEYTVNTKQKSTDFEGIPDIVLDYIT